MQVTNSAKINICKTLVYSPRPLADFLTDACVVSVYLVCYLLCKLLLAINDETDCKMRKYRPIYT